MSHVAIIYAFGIGDVLIIVDDPIQCWDHVCSLKYVDVVVASSVVNLLCVHQT